MAEPKPPGGATPHPDPRRARPQAGVCAPPNVNGTQGRTDSLGGEKPQERRKRQTRGETEKRARNRFRHRLSPPPPPPPRAPCTPGCVATTFKEPHTCLSSREPRPRLPPSLTHSLRPAVASDLSRSPLQLFGRFRTQTDRDRPCMAVVAPEHGACPIDAVGKGKTSTSPSLPFFRRLFARNEKKVEPPDDSLFEFPKKKRRRKFPFDLCFCSARIRRLVRLVVEDWIFLALLGIIMALLSFFMDWAIDKLQTEHDVIMKLIDQKSNDRVVNWLLMFLVWVAYAVLLVSGSALFVHYIAPQAIGSGIPEMKTVLRGVILKEYLTFRTLISKIVGLTFSLGSGLPIGKEGPFVHVASVVANLLSHLMHGFNGAYTNESRSSEMLAAGCAVGVACTFSAPVGGVLFSIEVTSVYFAVRNYWRGFFAATCSATIFRLLRVLNQQSVTVIAFYQTTFPREAFYISELPIFALIGLICGILSATFIFVQRHMVLFLRRNRFAKQVFQQYWLVYPILISFLVSGVTFPVGIGRYIGGDNRFSHMANQFFHNCTFIERRNDSDRYCGEDFIANWTDHGNISIFVSLCCFLVVYFFLAAVASTVPIPSGIFGPSFIIGGAVGRLVGEVVALLWTADRTFGVFPGVYAVVGAAAFCGGVTHTVSVAVIVFELTGQLIYILPVMIAVLIANAVCSYLQPSIYDSIIRIKHLPYLPDIPHSSSNFYGIRVEQFMTPKVRFLSKQSTYTELQELLIEMPRIKAFPILEDNSSRILIGSCSRNKLLRALDIQVGQEARQIEAHRRIRNAIADIDRRFKLIDGQRASISQGRPSIFDGIHRKDGLALPEMPVNALYRDGPPSPVPETPTTPSAPPSRFTVVPVEQDAQLAPSNAVPGLRSGGRRGALSVSQHDETEAVRKLSTASNTSSGKLSSKLSNSSLLSSLGKSLRRAKSLNNGHDTVTSRDVYHTIGGVFRTLTRLSFGRLKHRNHDEDYDLSGEEREMWERERLHEPLNLEDIGVDPAPFQLVEHSSLFKVHSLFSLLGLNRAYVTNCGRLVGVVALRDLRVAIERIQAGTLFSSSPTVYETADLEDDATETTIDDQEAEDAERDRLNPRLEVISRVSSHIGQHQTSVFMAKVNAQAEMGEAAARLARVRKLSTQSDPCIPLKLNIDTSQNDSVRPEFRISPAPSPTPPEIVVDSPPHTPTTIVAHSVDRPPCTLTRPGSTLSGRKKNRHVQICIPPTPDYKKSASDGNFAFDGPNSYR